MSKIKANQKRNKVLQALFESLEHRTLLSSYGTLNANWINTGPYSPATFMEGATQHGSPKIGQFDWQRLTASDPSGFGPGTFAGVPNPGDSFPAFCIELTQNLHQNNVPFNYEVRDLWETPSPNNPMGAMGVAKADFLSELWGRYFNQVGSDPIKGAAFQLDVWETVYDTDHNISTGDFQIVVNNATDAAIAAQAQTWLSGVTGTGPRADLLAMSSPDYQDMVFESPKPHNAALGDYVWADANANGVQDSGEAGIPNVKVNLLDSIGNPIASTMTDVSGFYHFTDLAPGNYQVQFVAPDASYVFSPTGQGTAATDSDANAITGMTALITLAPDQVDNTWDAGMYQKSALGDFVWADTNANGIQDAGEAGIAGVTVNLLDASSTQIGTTTTDSGGYYHFTDLTPGNYQVQFVMPDASYVFSPTGQGTAGTDSNADAITGISGPITLVSGQIDNTWDAGMRQRSSISGFVYVDSDNDGIKDAGEAGIGGVLVTLNGPNGLVLTQTTNPDGSYSFDDLLAGTYQLTETQPLPFLDGKDTIGSLGGITTNDMFSSIIVGQGQNGVNYNFGERTPCVTRGDFATIGFWHNRNGQALITGLNGSSSSTALAKWLATNFPNLYGPTCGVYAMIKNGVYLTNSQVAASYLNNFFNVSGMKVNAQILAAALGSYVTSTTLAGGTNAKPYGFNTSSGGTGFDSVNIGSDGAAFGVANNSTITVTQMLQYVNSEAIDGVLYAGNAHQSSLISMANDAFDKKVNSAGDIA